MNVLEPSMYSIDDNLSIIVRRLSSVADNLNTGVFGTSNKTELCDAREMESPSFASLAHRIEDIFNCLGDVERLTNKIHSSTPVVG